MVLFKGCDFFEEDHCLYETNESRIWTPDNNPAVAANYGVTFKFERSASINSIFKIENCCPYGALNVKVNIFEEPGFYTKPVKYIIYLYEGIIIKGKKFVKIPSELAVIRKTDTELWTDFTLVLDGFLEEGPREYYMVCEAELNDKFGLEAEEWAKNYIKKVEYKAAFIRY